jgi:hypothetical protein
MAKEEGWHRRHAVMLASQLPDKAEDARIILQLTMQLLTDFLAEPEEADKPAPVITLVRPA